MRAPPQARASLRDSNQQAHSQRRRLCICTIKNTFETPLPRDIHSKNTEDKSLQNLACPLLGLPPALDLRTVTAATASLIALFLGLDGRIDRKLKYFRNTSLLLCRALDIDRSHSVGNCLALFGRDGGKTLCSEELDASSLMSKI